MMTQDFWVTGQLDRNLSKEPDKVAVHRIKTSFHGFKNNNYLVIDSATGAAVVVDPSWEFDKLACSVERESVQLQGVLITHSHPDHIHLAKKMADHYCCPIWMSNEEIVYSGFNAKQLVPIGQVPWALGTSEIIPIPTPGHTPGCTCYLIGNNLFSGDVLFNEGCGLCPDRPSARAMYYSLRKLKATLRDDTRIYPGHTYSALPGQKFSTVIKSNIYLHFTDVDSFCNFRLRLGQDKSKMFKFS